MNHSSRIYKVYIPLISCFIYFKINNKLINNLSRIISSQKLKYFIVKKISKTYKFSIIIFEYSTLFNSKQVLLRMLPAYYNHVRAFENTLITKFYGLHCVKLTGAAQKKVCFWGIPLFF